MAARPRAPGAAASRKRTSELVAARLESFACAPRHRTAKRGTWEEPRAARRHGRASRSGRRTRSRTAATTAWRPAPTAIPAMLSARHAPRAHARAATVHFPAGRRRRGRMVKDGLFRRFLRMSLFGMHNQPGALGRFAVRCRADDGGQHFLRHRHQPRGARARPESGVEPGARGGPRRTTIQSIVSRNVRPVRDRGGLGDGIARQERLPDVIPQSARLSAAGEASAADLARIAHVAAGSGATANRSFADPSFRRSSTTPAKPRSFRRAASGLSDRTRCGATSRSSWPRSFSYRAQPKCPAAT